MMGNDSAMWADRESAEKERKEALKKMRALQGKAYMPGHWQLSLFIVVDCVTSLSVCDVVGGTRFRLAAHAPPDVVCFSGQDQNAMMAAQARLERAERRMENIREEQSKHWIACAEAMGWLDEAYQQVHRPCVHA